MDIYPTCLAAARANHPSTFNGEAVPPPEGISLLPALCGKHALPPDRSLFWERMGNEAMLQGRFKLVRGYGQSSDDGHVATKGPRTGEWELYDTSNDPGETVNLAANEPKRVEAMIRSYNQWSSRVGVVPREEILRRGARSER